MSVAQGKSHYIAVAFGLPCGFCINFQNNYLPLGESLLYEIFRIRTNLGGMQFEIVDVF